MKFFSTQKLIALSLIIFLSGTCCLLCCETMKAAASDKAESCPMGKGHHCCPKANTPNDAQAVSAGAGISENCCPFISKRFELAGKTELKQKLAAPVTLKISLPQFSLVEHSSFQINSYRSVVRNRGSTYLTNCVFRI